MVVSGLLSTPRRAEDLDSHVTHIFAETLKPSEKGQEMVGKIFHDLPYSQYPKYLLRGLLSYG